MTFSTHVIVRTFVCFEKLAMSSFKHDSFPVFINELGDFVRPDRADSSLVSSGFATVLGFAELGSLPILCASAIN